MSQPPYGNESPQYGGPPSPYGGPPSPYGGPPSPYEGPPSPYGGPPGSHRGPQYASPYPSPYGPGGSRRAKVSDPVIGWLLLAAAVVVGVGSFAPWADVDFASVHATVEGTDGDGVITVVFAVLALALGIVIGVRQGRVWAGIVALVAGALIALVALIDLGSVNGSYGALAEADVPDDVVSVAWGLWAVLVGGILVVAASIAALVKRS